MGEKLIINSNDYLADCFALGEKILLSDFKPNFLVAIWRGGTPVGIVIQEYLRYHGVKTDHIAIRTSGYDENDKSLDEVQVYSTDYVVETANSDDRMIIIDDVFDKMKTIETVLEKFSKKMRKNLPKKIRIAATHYKHEQNQTTIIPDYYIHKLDGDPWIVFPHEVVGLTIKQIAMKQPGLEKYFH